MTVRSIELTGGIQAAGMACGYHYTEIFEFLLEILTTAEPDSEGHILDMDDLEDALRQVVFPSQSSGEQMSDWLSRQLSTWIDNNHESLKNAGYHLTAKITPMDGEETRRTFCSIHRTNGEEPEVSLVPAIAARQEGERLKLAAARHARAAQGLTPERKL